MGVELILFVLFVYGLYLIVANAVWEIESYKRSMRDMDGKK